MVLHNQDQLFILVFAALMVLICFWLLFHYLKRARLIEDTPTSKIRSAAQGHVEIIGTAFYIQNEVLTAPLSGRACVWYTYKIQRYQRSGKSSRWSTIEEGTSEQRFLLKDDTGTCLIDPRGAEVLTAHSRTWYGNTPRPGQADNTHSLLKIFGNRRYRYIEKFIYAHDIIYALGYFHTSGGGRNIPNNHQMTGQVIREWKQNYEQIIARFDLDKNSEIDMQEWEAVRTAASQEAEKRRQNLSKSPTVHTLGKTTDKQHPFILSTLGQKTLAKKYRYFAFFSLTGVVCFAAFIAVQYFEY